jgi:hypothetical protein
LLRSDEAAAPRRKSRQALPIAAILSRSSTGCEEECERGFTVLSFFWLIYV